MRLKLPRRAASAALVLQTLPFLQPLSPEFLAAHPPAALAAAELTDEQALVVEAWAVIQRGFVDQQFNGNDWKDVRTAFLKRKYKNIDEARSAVSEMLGLLGDRFTRYLTPGAYASLLARFERPAGYGGIGVTVRNMPGTGSMLGPVEVVSIVDGGPAASAGVQVGDILESIDRRPLAAGISADDVAGLLLGKLEDPLSIMVRRPDGSSESIALKRVVLKVGEAEVRSARRNDGTSIGVLKLATFSAPVAGNGGGGTLESMQNLLASEPLVSAPALLIDLRGNLGGHFPSGVEAAKLFLPSDVTVVSTVDRTGKPSPILTFSKGPYANTARPTYILVNKGTASVAEVFAAALQDNRAAIVVGESTYGKGLVQSIQKLSTDNSAVVLTVAKYRTPRGDDINGKGIIPKLPVKCVPGEDAVSCLDAALGQHKKL